MGLPLSKCTLQTRRPGVSRQNRRVGHDPFVVHPRVALGCSEFVTSTQSGLEINRGPRGSGCYTFRHHIKFFRDLECWLSVFVYLWHHRVSFYFFITYKMFWTYGDWYLGCLVNEDSSPSR